MVTREILVRALPFVPDETLNRALIFLTKENMVAKPSISLDSAQSALRATTARALAEALICGIDLCAEEGTPLSQNQQIRLAVMSHMAYDQALESCAGLTLEATLFRSRS